ncbi:MAG TPA: inositol monophosphatase, partial [Acidimicrobiaceae bacterium]|nr:inositol monophosphatase [Acidimicrobiaceae bacterium]
PLAGALVNASDFAAFTPAQFGALRAAGAMLRTWGDAYGYFLVATGAADVMIDPVCETWDLAPMPVILAEAGGVFTDVAGNPSYTSRNGVASNGPLHPAVLEAMNAGS